MIILYLYSFFKRRQYFKLFSVTFALADIKSVGKLATQVPKTVGFRHPIFSSLCFKNVPPFSSLSHSKIKNVVFLSVCFIRRGIYFTSPFTSSFFLTNCNTLNFNSLFLYSVQIFTYWSESSQRQRANSITWLYIQNVGAAHCLFLRKIWITQWMEGMDFHTEKNALE